MNPQFRLRRDSTHFVSLLVAISASLLACGGDDSTALPDGGQAPGSIGFISDQNSAVDSVLEGRPIGEVVGLTLLAVDPNQGDTVTYSLTDDAEGRFQIDSQTGVVTLAKVVDFESEVTHTIAARAQSSDSSSSAAMFSVSVIDNLGPVVEIVFPRTGYAGEALTARGTVSDAEGDTATVTIKTTEGEVVALVDANGTWEAAGVSFGTNTNPMITASAVDSAGEVAIDVVHTILRETLVISPRRVVVEAEAERAYLTDNGRILRLDMVRNEVTILSGSGAGTGASFAAPTGLALDQANGLLYVTDFSRDRISSVDLLTGNRAEVSGPTVGAGPAFNFSLDLSYDAVRSRLYVLDRGIIYAVDLTTGDRTVLSDSADYPGQGYSGRAMVLNAAGDTIYYVGTLASSRGILGNKVTRVDVSTGVMTLLSDDSLGSGDELEQPEDIVLDEANNRLLIIDAGALSVVAVDLSTGDRSYVSSAAVGTGDLLGAPIGLFYDAVRAQTYVIDALEDGLYSIDAAGARTLEITSSVGDGPHISRPERAAALDLENGRLLVVTQHAVNQTGSMGDLYSVDLATGTRTLLSSASLGTGPTLEKVHHVVYEANSGLIYVSDVDLQAILAIDPATGNRSVVASAAVGTGPEFPSVTGMALSDDGDSVWIVTGFGLLLELELSSGNRTEIFGPATSTLQIVAPQNMIYDSENSRLLLCDSGTNAGVFAIDPVTLVQTTIADDTRGAGSNIQSAFGLALDATTGTIYLLDRSAKYVYSIDVATGDRTRLSGNTLGSGFAFLAPNSIVFDPGMGKVLLADIHQDAIWTVDTTSGARVIFSK